MIKDVLQKLNFTEKESAVYTALLQLGTAKVNEIANRTELNRTTIYDVVETLIHKGLISKFRKHKTTYFSVHDPRQLLTYLDREKQEFVQDVDKKKKMVEDSLSEMVSLQNLSATRPKVQFYEGEKGLREAYENSLECRDVMYAYTNVATMYDALPNFFPDYFKRRAKNKIPIKAVFVKNKKSFEQAKLNTEELRQTKFVPDENISWSPEVKIYNDKVLIASWTEKMAVIIESKEYADLQKHVFEMLWEYLPKSA